MAEPNFTNRTVWVGDNLHVMRRINSECIDLIYFYPPFNSKQDYAAPIGSLKVMEVGYILPRSRGGTDHVENLQLLCSHCNRSKGNRTISEWRAG